MSRAETGELESAIYQVLLSLRDRDERLRFLDRVYPGDDPAKGEMMSLVESSEEAARYFCEASDSRTKVAREVMLESSGTDDTVVGLVGLEEEEAGSTLGRYRIIRRLGEGGSGVVYEAEQEQPIRRRVAVKVLRHGDDSKSIIARFEAERQALALMDHPCIARVLDAGTTGGGRPYFVMELVKGERISTYCDVHRLTIRERIDLFIQVCHAIQHAHQKGIIHRDIKPSNILVVDHGDGAHSPKVIDFGIAKATGPQGLGDSTVFTSHDQFFGTPAYASPEQLDMTSIDIDTRSDVYSLGVLFYELLISKPPLTPDRTEGLSISKLHQAIVEAKLIQPSVRLRAEEDPVLAGIAADRKMEPTQLINAIRGDLDSIVLKAMANARSHRYQTVNSLILDLGRYLENQPVLARPPGRLYLMHKFARRNSLAVGLSVSLVLLLVAALVLTTSLYRRAESSRDLQLRLKNEAEAAREMESRLLRQSEARANVARAAMLLDQGRIDEADALRKKYPLSSIEPSLEAAAVFRSLGDWNANQGRMDQAIPCYRLLMQANRFDRPDAVLQGVDLLVIGAALVEFSLEEYRSYRREVIDTYMTPVPAGTTQAEHLLKFCLLDSITPELLSELQPAVDILEKRDLSAYSPWDELALGLFYLRGGKCDTAIELSQMGLANPSSKLSCKAAFHAVIALSYQGRGDNEAGDKEIAVASEVIRDANGSDSIGGQPVESCWWDWAIAKALVREYRRTAPASDS